MFTLYPNLTRALDRLEDRGLLHRIRSKEDRRVVWVYLEQSGEALMNEIYPKFIEWANEMTSALNEDEIQQLDQLVQKIWTGWKDNQASE